MLFHWGQSRISVFTTQVAARISACFWQSRLWLPSSHSCTTSLSSHGSSDDWRSIWSDSEWSAVLFRISAFLKVWADESFTVCCCDGPSACDEAHQLSLLTSSYSFSMLKQIVWGQECKSCWLLAASPQTASLWFCLQTWQCKKHGPSLELAEQMAICWGQTYLVSFEPLCIYEF